MILEYASKYIEIVLKPLYSSLLYLVTTLFFKTVIVPHYSTKMLYTCHDKFIGIQKSSIFQKSHTSYWLIKYSNPKLISWDTINTC
jgi:hypothetical protein